MYALWDWLLHQVPAFVGLGLVPTADSPDPVPPDIRPSSYERRPFSLEFTAPADYSSRELRPRKSSDLGRRDVTLAPGDVFITNVHYLLSSFCSC